MRDALIDGIAKALEDQKVTVERMGDTLNAKVGMGLTAHKANLDLEPLLARLESEPEARHARLIAGFVSGVKGVLLEPSRSKAGNWSYSLSAGRMVPTLEVDTFALGVQAASGEEAWTMPFAGDLVIGCMVELDRGRRALTKPQVERWGATDDRVYSAARSMLFHRTRESYAKPQASEAGVHSLKVGDGYDAMRGFILTDLYYAELDESRFRFAAPHPDTILYTDDASSYDALAAATRDAHAEAEYPLSDLVYRLEGRSAVPVEGA